MTCDVLLSPKMQVVIKRTANNGRNSTTCWLSVILIVNESLRVDRRGHVCEQIASRGLFHVHIDLKVTVTLYMQRVQVSLQLVALHSYSGIEVLLLPLLRNRILILNDEMDFIVGPTFVRPEHDRVSCVRVQL